MPQIIVVANGGQGETEDAVMLRERISASDLESHHFATHLLERLEWAVGDAHEVEQVEAPSKASTDRRAQQAELVGSRT